MTARWKKSVFESEVLAWRLCSAPLPWQKVEETEIVICNLLQYTVHMLVYIFNCNFKVFFLKYVICYDVLLLLCCLMGPRELQLHLCCMLSFDFEITHILMVLKLNMCI